MKSTTLKAVENEVLSILATRSTTRRYFRRLMILLGEASRYLEYFTGEE
jgi:hypothetical protein